MSDLHQAAAAGNYEKVKEILRHKKCSPNERDIEWRNKTPLHWATGNGQTEMVRVLIDNGARTCLRTEHGWTPAHYAAESGHLAVLQLLHSFHAPMDKRDECGDRPVRVAEIYGHSDCVEFLQKAELECQAYRRMSAEQGIAMDDSDEEWSDNGK
ncbi:ankyrin repeat domain-containing protein 66-like [Solea solea]|uniref:ankyrin repeat domain-containing protein 66-like n=1 Tax=Solea solea TaxID=90069 RepID=UPI00272D2464|nr:ankyrin repeat domain-containing protein 66-like [Solea solea]